MRRGTLLLLIVVGALVAGCGDDGPDYRLQTPPVAPGDVPLAPKGQKLVDTKPTAKDVAKVKPTILAWARAVRENQPFKAAAFFDLPTVASVPAGNLSLNTVGVAAAFSSTFECAPAKLVKLSPVGRFVVGEFVQQPYAGRPCATGKNQIERIGFVFGNPDHPDQFTELWQAPPSDKAETGPATRPTDGIPVQAAQLEQLAGLG